VYRKSFFDYSKNGMKRRDIMQWMITAEKEAEY